MKSKKETESNTDDDTRGGRRTTTPGFRGPTPPSRLMQLSETDFFSKMHNNINPDEAKARAKYKKNEISLSMGKSTNDENEK